MGWRNLFKTRLLSLRETTIDTCSTCKNNYLDLFANEIKQSEVSNAWRKKLNKTTE